MASDFLRGVKVIDFTGFLSGPYCGMYLADLGADVTLFENKNGGMFVRNAIPFDKKSGDSMYFGNLNRNKRGIAVDLQTEAGKKIMRRLIENSDVLLENMRPGVIAKLGFPYEEVKKINPRMVMASISGFGQHGEYSKRPGYDLIAQAMGGAMSVTGFPDQAPVRSGIAIGDMIAVLNTAVGILAALHRRDQTGVGAYVDVSLVDSIISSLEAKAMQYIYDGDIAQKQGNRYTASAPYESFKAKDDFFVIASGTDKHFIALAEMMGMPELAEDERFNTTPGRRKNADALKEIMEAEWSSKYTAKECVEKVNGIGVPAALIYNVEQVYKDDFFHNTREMFVKIPYEYGTLEVLGNPIHFDGEKLDYYKRAPKLGEDNVAVLTELGFSEKEIEEFKEKGAI